mmetsp:Transcript_15957/g.32984  ORF Transcript_15957/g.32984 Transcript_15957/m.32984 type:complete len:134 (-) Transcript_15957:21-422(-)
MLLRMKTTTTIWQQHLLAIVVAAITLAIKDWRLQRRLAWTVPLFARRIKHEDRLETASSSRRGLQYGVAGTFVALLFGRELDVFDWKENCLRMPLIRNETLLPLDKLQVAIRDQTVSCVFLDVKLDRVGEIIL